MSHSPRAQLQEAVKPMLRGYSHAITAPLALLATVVLAVMAAGDTARQVTVLIYGATMVLLFSGSALYHVGNWSQRTREVLQRLDHSNIFLLIAGTYTPIAFVVLAGWQRAAVLGAVWGLSLVGVAIAIGGVKLPRPLFVGLYLLVGWVAVLAVPAIFARVGIGGAMLLLAGGVLYSAGAACYALKRPRLWQRVFSYHEVFHLFVIAASATFLVFIAIYVVSLPRG
ncbi:MAG TPA: hemolysin III family protein [Candidatus Dormibacteraeota bacterium]|nr:hemolysin III family protein [Candidatus Dormibacteraeota bacterium]